MSQELMIANEYGFGSGLPANSIDSSMMQVEQSRAMAEVQACFVIAKRFPRDDHAAFNRIMKACERPFLAAQSMYAFPRGGSVVTGPSIRLAEVMAQSWGNIDFGVREISQGNGFSIAEAFAIDLETNTRKNLIFHVSHDRHTKKGKQRLTDPRDIYELVANNGARRLRACILAIIPGDIMDAAVERCKHTLTHGKEPLADRIRKLVLAFDEQGVKIEHIEKRLGHKVDAIIEVQMVDLRGIYKSLKDGMSKREDFFEMRNNNSSASSSVDELIANKKNTSKINDSEKYQIEEDNLPSFSDQVKLQLNNAKSIETLYIAADLINEAEDEYNEELTSLFKKREKDFN